MRRWTTAASASWSPSTACRCPSTSSPSRTPHTTRCAWGAGAQWRGPVARLAAGSLSWQRQRGGACCGRAKEPGAQRLPPGPQPRALPRLAASLAEQQFRCPPSALAPHHLAHPRPLCALRTLRCATLPPAGGRHRLHPHQLQLWRLVRAGRALPALRLCQGALLPVRRQPARGQGGRLQLSRLRGRDVRGGRGAVHPFGGGGGSEGGAAGPEGSAAEAGGGRAGCVGSG